MNTKVLELNPGIMWTQPLLNTLIAPLKELEVIKNGRFIIMDYKKIIAQERYKFVNCTFEVFLEDNESVILDENKIDRLGGSTSMNFYSLRGSNIKLEDVLFYKTFHKLGDYMYTLTEISVMLDSNINNRYFKPLSQNIEVIEGSKTELNLRINKTLNHN